ncbi:excinuclease ABC subunit UvrB [Ignavibacteria bacterium CHB1]|nr:MAG: excinuclease ABC subunit UvrB [Chlorobiota bacterium]MBV6397819.1 UvrABC system protein B [Ignavibacteria bacterium]MCC6885592.1 excinuclease ABC subunit UvrB [Ignavibacteriales bacterium]MCE7952952.1 excinuclease ABC subunit UvrB [Chlorobi bacterium CHB7]MDL1887927.1 excinuclease ABC subunit UvrB [Ignavibacteria bacterium CHB1]RIK49705.1 MAG: excinuclease ABC subunit B [Ignavibacteriota bacterium]
MNYKLISGYKPTGDQPRAIKELTEGIQRGDRYQTFLGVTGSGKTFSVSNVIQNIGKPVLVMSHNKTLAAQLYGEFKRFFPDNRVEFFISYYDYYQPEAYIPSTDTYIQKDLSINEDIDRLRLRATASILEGRKDVIVVSSVSCIYGIGAPEEYAEQVLVLKLGQKIKRKALLNKLIYIHYVRNDYEFSRGTFRVRGDTIEIIPAYEIDTAIRIELFDNEIEKLSYVNAEDGKIIGKDVSVVLYPAKYFVTNKQKLELAIDDIRAELEERIAFFQKKEKYVEAQRLEQRTNFDIEMIQEVGYCNGIENYSRHLDRRPPGSRPSCLFDYFPEDYLLVVDESHVTVPQIGGMYNGDRMRKKTLVEHGFRLPSALDNRPMTFEEWESMIKQVIFVSATPGNYELEKSEGVIVEQIIRPTGLLDPEIQVKPVKNQIDDLLNEIRKRAVQNERVLVTTLTKRMSEDLTDYLLNLNVRVKYIHSEINSLDRVEILRDLRLGKIDVIVGVNLLREGLDLPEVSLVAILDADKEGFLRSEKSLLQTAGRTARNVNGMVIFYADKVTESMSKVISETARRRKIQQEYNEANNIQPETVYKSYEDIISTTIVADSISKNETYKRKSKSDESVNTALKAMIKPVMDETSNEQRKELIEQLRKEMIEAAKDLEFERAAELRDELQRLSN